MKNIFLTGSTGFLGTHLVKEFVKREETRLFCLIRSESEENARHKLINALGKYDITLSDAELAKIEVVCGDLEKDRLGLSEEKYEELSEKTDVVFHNAAWVNWLLPVELLGKVNTKGTRRMLEFAAANKDKRFYFVSSLSVFPFDGKDYTEDSDIDDDFMLYGGYAQSKWLAEMVVQDAMKKGKDIFIFRPNLITGRASDGVFSHSAFFENCLKSFIQLGTAPRLKDTYMATVPVDYVSRGMVEVVYDSNVERRVFHLSNAGYASMEQILAWLGELGYEIEVTSIDKWKHKLFADKNFFDNALYKFKPFVYGLEDGYMLMGKAYSEKTDEYMRSHNIICPQLDKNLLMTYVENFKKSGFLKEES